MRILRLYPAHLIYLTLSLALVSTIAQAQDGLTDNNGTLQVSTGSHLVHFTNDNLTVKVKDVSLYELLDEIARQSGLTVVRYVALDERRTLEFHRLSLEEGLRRILRSRSFVLAYVQQTREEWRSVVARPMTLWVLPQGEENRSGQNMIVGNTNAKVSSEELVTGFSQLHAALSSEAAEDREEAVLELGDSNHAEALPSLTLALADENKGVREAAVIALAEIGGAEATQTLVIALGDEDPRIRVEAVGALGKIGGDVAIGLLEQTLADHEHFVREAAAEILSQLRKPFQ